MAHRLLLACDVAACVCMCMCVVLYLFLIVSLSLPLPVCSHPVPPREVHSVSSSDCSVVFSNTDKAHGVTDAHTFVCDAHSLVHSRDVRRERRPR